MARAAMYWAADRLRSSPADDITGRSPSNAVSLFGIASLQRRSTPSYRTRPVARAKAKNAEVAARYPESFSTARLREFQRPRPPTVVSPSHHPPTSRGKNNVSSAVGSNVVILVASPGPVRTAAVYPFPVSFRKRLSASAKASTLELSKKS